MSSTSAGWTASALATGAGVPAGSRLISVSGSSPWPVPVPTAQGIPLTRWSLPRLSVQLAGEGIAVSPRHLGTLLARGRPLLSAHAHLEGQPRPRLRAQGRADPGVVREAADRRGGGQLRPDGPGQPAPDRRAPAGRRKGRPERQRADYNRRAGIRYVFGAYDVHADRLRVRLRPQRAGSDMLALHAPDPARLPARQRIYWIQDNLSANWMPPIRAFAAANHIELVADPDLRQLPEPGRVSLLRARPSSSSPTPTTSTGTRFGYALARHVTLPKRRSPRPPPRGRRNPTPHRRLMTFRVQQSLRPTDRHGRVRPA